MILELDSEAEMDMNTTMLLDLIKSVTRLEVKVEELCAEMRGGETQRDDYGDDTMHEPMPAGFSQMLESQIFTDVSNQFDLIGF